MGVEAGGELEIDVVRRLIAQVKPGTTLRQGIPHLELGDRQYQILTPRALIQAGNAVITKVEGRQGGDHIGLGTGNSGADIDMAAPAIGFRDRGNGGSTVTPQQHACTRHSSPLVLAHSYPVPSGNCR